MRGLLTDHRTASGLVQKYIGTAYDVVKYVHDNLDSIITAAAIPGVGEIPENVEAAEAAAQAAEQSRIYAEVAETGATGAYEEFSDFYLGARATPPYTDNDGNPLQSGALYQDTSVTPNVMKFYNGANWLLAYSTVDVTSHGNLSYLGSDDHLQYLNELRHEAVDHLHTSDFPPNSPSAGMLWLNSANGTRYAWYTSPINGNSQWIANTK